MKKRNLILVFVIILVLITTGCGVRIVPVSEPQGPQAGDQQPGGPQLQGSQPGSPQSGAPQPGGPQSGAPQPGVPQPGGLQPGGPQPGDSQPGGPQPGDSQPDRTPQPIGPPHPGPAHLVPTTTPGPALSTISAQKANLDLAASDIYAESSGRIMLTIKNVGFVPVKGNIPVQCGALINNGPAEKVTNQNLPVDLAVGAAADVDTGFKLDPSISKMAVACSVWAPQDANPVNDSTDYTQVR
jgi:hypothetical protein